MNLDQLKNTIEQAWENRAALAPQAGDPAVKSAVNDVIALLDAGTLRVAEKANGEWITHQWLKKAVLLSFRMEDNRLIRSAPPTEHREAGFPQFYDKVPTKFEHYTEDDFKAGGFRVVPPAVARRGAFIGKGVVLMPSYVNIGAYVDEGSMVDTWATVGSCA